MKKKVIVIDDCCNLLEIAQMSFNNKHLELCLLSSGELLEPLLINENKIKAVITDFIMPNYNGLKIMELINKNKEKVEEFYLMSGLDLKEHDLLKSSFNIDKIFEKPINFKKQLPHLFLS